MADLFAVRGIELLGRGLRAATEASEAARADVMLGALYGGYALSTGGTAGAHALQYPIGAATHTAHGVGVGALLPYVMEFNRPARVPEFATTARALGADSTADEEELSAVAVDEVARLLRAVGIPSTLAELGLDRDRLGWVAEQGGAAARLVENNPRELTTASLRAIVHAAFDGDRAALRG